MLPRVGHSSIGGFAVFLERIMWIASGSRGRYAPPVHMIKLTATQEIKLARQKTADRDW
jgi:hypothetical protein